MGMRKYKEVYPNRIAALLNYSWDRDYLKSSLGDKISNMDIFRWASNEFYPPVHLLPAIAMCTGMSTSYLLGQTNVKGELEHTDGKPRDIAKVMEAKSLTYKDVALRAGTKPKTAEKLVSDFPAIRTNSFIAISDALGVSTDYLLGLTDQETWDDLTTISDIAPGCPAFIDDGSPSGCYVLINDAGDLAYFATGRSLALTDAFFTRKKIIPITVGTEPKR